MQKKTSFIAVASWTLTLFVAGHLSAFQNIPSSASVISLSGSNKNIATWSDQRADHYAIDRGDGKWHVVNNTSYALRLRYAQFDPLVGVPPTPENLRNNPPQADGVFIVQFVTQPIQEYRDEIRALGGTIYNYLPHHAYLVQLDAETHDAIQQLPYVRWIGEYQPAYKLEEILLAAVQAGAPGLAPTRVNIMVLERGPRQKNLVAQRIAAVGGRLDSLTPNGFRLEATLNGAQLLAIASLPQVMWIDLWSEGEEDMDIARAIGGANYIESVAGYTGQGVRAEVMDGNLFSNHVDFQSIPPIFHGPHTGSDDHGTGTYGINFATGTGDPMGRGMLPSAQGIFADYGLLNDRYQHTAELVQSPYFAVYQSNSWGNTQTTSYNSISAEMDDIIFINDIIITQSQSNLGNQLSRPQAWAKNIVAVGGIHHLNTASTSDDFWNSASIGPAADGRVKPDLAHFYDLTWTTDDTVSGYREFGGTSGATPIVAGHFGLLFQMWSDGIFGNDVQQGGTVFENRAHASTAKALMINRASSYTFTGTNANLTRTHQGWGLPDLQRIYDARDSMFIVDEQVVLENLETAIFELVVPDQTPEFRATLVYSDLMGTTSSNLHRINDLTLKVTTPNNTVYWGNNGLLAGNWSTPGGNPNTIDTVENVFLQNPQPGIWTVEVIASEINEDAHVETGAVDADFGLVVSGVGQAGVEVVSFNILRGILLSGDLQDIVDSDDSYLKFNPGITLSQSEPPVWIEIDGSLPDDNPASLMVSMEASANTVGLTQTIEMFNYNSSTYQQVDAQAASFNTDSIFTIDVSDGIADFVEAGTGDVRTRVGWRATGPILLFPWTICIDQVDWSVTE